MWRLRILEDLFHETSVTCLWLLANRTSDLASTPSTSNSSGRTRLLQTGQLQPHLKPKRQAGYVFSTCIRCTCLYIYVCVPYAEMKVHWFSYHSFTHWLICSLLTSSCLPSLIPFCHWSHLKWFNESFTRVFQYTDIACTDMYTESLGFPAIIERGLTVQLFTTCTQNTNSWCSKHRIWGSLPCHSCSWNNAQLNSENCWKNMVISMQSLALVQLRIYIIFWEGSQRKF